MQTPSPVKRTNRSSCFLGWAVAGVFSVLAGYVFYHDVWLPSAPKSKGPPTLDRRFRNDNALNIAVEQNGILTVVSAPYNLTAEFGRASYVFRTSVPAIINLGIYDAQTNLVRTILTTNQTAGDCPVEWDMTDDQGHKVLLPDDTKGRYRTDYWIKVAAEPLH